MTFLGIAIPALLIALAMRRWFAPLPWNIIALALLLTLAFLHGAVVTTRVPVAVDEVMRGYPYRGVFGAIESSNPLTNDTVKQILPWMQIVREELRNGRMPLWNRYQFSGYPLLGNGQSAPFAPIFLSTLFVPLPHQIVAMAGLKIFLALLFSWLFLRDEGVSAAAALFGAAVFSFSVFQTVYLYYPMTSVSSLLPAAAFALRGCVRDGSRRWLVLLAIVTAAVASGGHPESAMHIGIACAVMLVIEWRNPKRAILAAAVGVAIASPAWVPVVEQALRSVRAAALAAAPHPPLDYKILWVILNPDGYGNPSRGNWQWIYNYSIVAPVYVGLLPLALLFSARRTRDLTFVIASFVLFLVAMDWTPIGHLINAVPPLNLIAQDRLRFVVVFFVAVVAARVVDRATTSAAVASIFLIAAATFLLYAKWNITLSWYSVAGIAALVLFWIVFAFRRDFAPAAAFVAVVIELFVFNAGFNVLTSRAYYRPSMPILETARELSRGEPSRIVAHDWTFLPNAAAQYGLEDVRGSDPMALASYASFFDRVAIDDPSSDIKRVHDVDHPALAFLGVRFLLTEPAFTPSSAWLLRYEGPDGKLYESTRWHHRFFALRGDARVGTITQESPTTLHVTIDAPRETLIASSQVWAPGWRVNMGRIVRLHDTFIGIVVPKGTHTITLRYRPLSFYASCMVSLVAMLAGLIWLRSKNGHRA
jgi:hypothetical protein